MKIDFAIIDTDKNEAEIKDILTTLGQLPILIDSITCPYYYLKLVKSHFKTQTQISCLIDFPLGISDSKSRLFFIEQAIKAGANAVDIVMPQNLATNRKYDKIREDIGSISEICKPASIEIRYILEYRVFDHHCLKKMCEILDQFQVKKVFPSTGYFLDNLADNLIASMFLHENSKEINIYCSGNAWIDKHFDIIEKTGLYGIRLFSISGLESYIKKIIEKQKNIG